MAYFNDNREPPTLVDTTYLFTWYKPNDMYHTDLIENYFIKNENLSEMIYEKEMKISDFPRDIQFSDYKKLRFDDITPFIQQYFTPADDIRERIMFLEKKYKIKRYDNLCVLFYRGNDKQLETIAPSYETFIKKARILKEENPDIRFLIQSDETGFIKTLEREFPDAIVFHSEIRHIPRCSETVDNVHREKNTEFSKYFLAIVLIMAKCKYLVCTSGNCSIWITFYRGNAENLYQYLEDKPVIYDVPNEDYDPFKRNFWLR